MSCQMLDRQLQTALTLPERAALERHAEGCDECRARLIRLRQVRGVLGVEVPALDELERARWWRAVQSQLHRPAGGSGRGWLLAPAALAAGLLLLLFTRPPAEGARGLRLAQGSARAWSGPAAWSEGQVLPSATWVVLAAGSRAGLADLELRAQSEVALLVADEPQRLELRLYSGRILLQRRPSVEPVLLVTPVAELTWLGGQVELEVEARRAVVRAQGELYQGGRLLPTGAALELQAPAAVQPERAAIAAPPLEPTAAAPIPALPRREAPPRAPPQLARELARAPEEEERPDAPRKSVEPEQDVTDRAAVAQARALVGQDAARAAGMAEAVLARRPSGANEAAALMVAADARRRSGDRAQAEGYYARAAAHPDGAGFAEEASLRRAVLLSELGRGAEARGLLEAAAERFGQGGLAPERAAWLARLELEAGELERAAQALERIPADRAEVVLERPRLDVARALLSRDAARAARLLTSLLAGSGPAADEARTLLGRK